MKRDSSTAFEDFFAEPLRNGLTKPKRVRGAGTKMVNMGELFANDRIHSIQMDRVPMTEREARVALLERGDLLFARQSLVREGAGQCSIFFGDSEPTTFESHLIRARLDQSKASPLFYYYFFRSPQGRLMMDSIIEQVAAAGIRGSDLAKLPVPDFELPVQKRIAHILGTLDDKIELNRRTNRTLEAIAREIFKSWFVDFDPVHAKAEGREPVGMDPETAALFPNSFQDSPLGKIPKGWEVKAFSEIVQMNPPRTLRKGRVAAYVDMASLPTSGSQLQAEPATREYKSGSRFQNGDVLFARITPCLENGKTVLVDFLADGEVGAGSTEFLVFGPCLAGTYFAYCGSRWSAVREHSIASMTGTSGRQRAQKGAFDHFEMAVPNAELLADFEARVAPLFAVQRSASQESRGLSAIRDTLLPRLLSGEVCTPGESRNGC